MYSEALRRKDLRSQHGRTQHQGRWDEHNDENPNILSLPQASEKWAKIQVVVAINDHTYKSLRYAYAFFWPLQSKLYEFVLLGEYQWLFSPFRCPFFGTQMWPKCELRFLPTVMVSSRHRILACWSFTSWELPRAWRPKSFARPVRTTLAKHLKVMAAVRKALRVLYSFKGFLGGRLLNIEPAYNWYNFRIHDNFRYIHV